MQDLKIGDCVVVTESCPYAPHLAHAGQRGTVESVYNRVVYVRLDIDGCGWFFRASGEDGVIALDVPKPKHAPKSQRVLCEHWFDHWHADWDRLEATTRTAA